MLERNRVLSIVYSQVPVGNLTKRCLAKIDQTTKVIQARVLFLVYDSVGSKSYRNLQCDQRLILYPHSVIMHTTSTNKDYPHQHVFRTF